MMHFIMAFVLLFVLFAFYGQRQNERLGRRLAVAARRRQTSPAIAAGLQVGDQIVSVDGSPVSGFDQTVDLSRPGRADGARSLRARRRRRSRPTATLDDHNPEGKAVGFLGVGAHYPT